MERPSTRRDFLRLAGGAAAAVMAVGCNSGSDKPKSSNAAEASAGGDRTLRIALWSHFIPGYDAWFDEEYTRRWGERHDVDVVVDHIPYAELGARAEAEVAAKSGHDIFGFITPPPVFEDEVIDHREIVEEVEAKLGKMSPLVERNVLNLKTGKYFGFAEYWAPNPAHYRVDLWNQVQPGLGPKTWDDILRAAPKLKAMGYPVGIGMSPDDDSSFSLFSLLAAYGSRIQNEDGGVAINSPATVEAVKMGAAIYRAGMTDEIFLWESSSNNRLLATGRGSLIFNAISAIRAAEDQDQELAGNVALAAAPAGPAARLGAHSVVNVYVIWRFARNREAAQQFLADLALDYREHFLRSRFYNLPAFPKSVPDLAELVTNDEKVRPAGKYALLADAEKWSTNIGHPGHANAATDEVFFQFIVPKMFAAAARGEMSAEEAVRAAETQMKPIFDKWREKGKI
jgi:multiple sugar transport system substrate-binding protein